MPFNLKFCLKLISSTNAFLWPRYAILFSELSDKIMFLDVCNPQIYFKSVDLPDPFGPLISTISLISNVELNLLKMIFSSTL